MAASRYPVVSKEEEIQIFRHNWSFRHACVYKQSTLAKKWKCNIFVKIWYSYFRYTGRHFLGCGIFLAVTLLHLYEKRRRNKATEQSTQKNLCKGHPFFDCTCSFLCHFLFSYSFTTFPKWCTYGMAPITVNIAVGGTLCDLKNMKISCNLILYLQNCFS